MPPKAPSVTSIGHYMTEQMALARLCSDALRTAICFYLFLKYSAAISYGTAFEDSCEHSWEIPSLKCPFIHLLSVAGSLCSDISYFAQLFQNLFHLTQSQFIILHTPPFLSPPTPFLSLWHSAKFIRALFPLLTSLPAAGWGLDRHRKPTASRCSNAQILRDPNQAPSIQKLETQT